ncbi:MAG: aminotransferase class III-fold pyridoxal phosphate-dependent enzyme [Chloroflexi bacterium]|nr:aminotransferase class III-fold pyridoxal phosphate-dependent enzyme [Chloroflexota bacterium]
MDGRDLIDLEMSFGAALLGHGHPAIVQAVTEALRWGLLTGHDTPHQIELAQRLVALIPSAEMVRFTVTGTETTWHAARIARAFTGRDLVVKFEGHFHGFNDTLGYNFWPPPDHSPASGETRVRPESAGTPEADRALVRVLPWNDLDALRTLLHGEGDRVAAVVMEPVNIDSGTIHPLPGYLAGVRELVDRHGALLVFDEILSGFRTNTGGAQADLGVTPDLTTIGKAVGGGMPLSAICGRRDVMTTVAPAGPVIHSGTFLSHLTAVLAASAFLDVATEPGFYPSLITKADRLVSGLREVFRNADLPVRVQQYGARFSLLFGIIEEPRRYRDVAREDRLLSDAFYRHALDVGVYLNPGWHHGISSAHTDADIDEALEHLQVAADRTAAMRDTRSA